MSANSPTSKYTRGKGTPSRVLVLVAFVPHEPSEPRVFRPLLYHLAKVRIGLPPAPVYSTYPVTTNSARRFLRNVIHTVCIYEMTHEIPQIAT